MCKVTMPAANGAIGRCVRQYGVFVTMALQYPRRTSSQRSQWTKPTNSRIYTGNHSAASAFISGRNECVIHRHRICASRICIREQSGLCCRSNPKRTPNRSSLSAQRASTVQKNSQPDEICMPLVRSQTAGTPVCRLCKRVLSPRLPPLPLRMRTKRKQSWLFSCRHPQGFLGVCAVCGGKLGD